MFSLSASPPDTAKHLTAMFPRMRWTQQSTTPNAPHPSSAFGSSKQPTSSELYSFNWSNEMQHVIHKHLIRFLGDPMHDTQLWKDFEVLKLILTQHLLVTNLPFCELNWSKLFSRNKKICWHRAFCYSEKNYKLSQENFQIVHCGLTRSFMSVQEKWLLYQQLMEEVWQAAQNKIFLIVAFTTDRNMFRRK